MGANGTKITINNSLSYEGQTKDARPHGKGYLIEVCADGERRLQGTFQEGKVVRAKAKLNNLVYEGETNDNSFSGNGRLVDEQNGTIYEGFFLNGALIKGSVSREGVFKCEGSYEKRHGSKPDVVKMALHGDDSTFELFEKKQKWKGMFWKGDISGEGTYTRGGEESYSGNFYCGRYCHQGIYHRLSPGNQLSIDGTFENGEAKYQQNKVVLADGSQFKGQIKNGLLSGECEYTFADGTTYRGSIHQQEFSGECEIVYPKSSAVEIFRGEIHEGKYNGLGILEYRNGVIVKGYFCQNAKNGPCILIYGSQMYRAFYLMDKLVGDIRPIDKESNS